MQSLTFQQSTGFIPAAMINRSQENQELRTEVIRDAVRSWAATSGQDVVAALIVEEWHQQGGEGIKFPDDIGRQRQKLFRFLDNRFNSDRYRENVRLLTPAILAVLPLEFRDRLVPQDSKMVLLANAEKELAEAKQALMLNAPAHQVVKEVREGIESLLRLLPVETLGPVLSGLVELAPGLM